jgi:hypothetical protein
VVGSDEIKDSRGVAIADFDGDGRLDITINNSNNRPTVLFNNLKKSGNWMGVKLVGDQSNRDAIGAHVLLTASDKTMMRQIEAGSGYSSQAMMVAHFGIGEAEQIDGLEIRWPNGNTQKFEAPALAGMINQIITIEEGRDTLVAQR